jgi:predicted DNA-binding helix-hairpin-helix protein
MINGLIKEFWGGIEINNRNIRVALYANYIVHLATNPGAQQNIIKNLAIYCDTWSRKIEYYKYKTMVFRRGSRYKWVAT